MKPALSIRRPRAFAAMAPASTLPVKPRTNPAAPNLVKGTYQPRTQSMLDYLVETLRKSW